MKPMTSYALIRVAGLTLLVQGSLAPVHAQYAPNSRAVTITLRAEATVDDTVVTLDQIAKLSGGSQSQRKRLGKLDVVDFPANASSRVVTTDVVRFRLLLSGLEASDFHLNGARRTTIVEPDESISFRRLLVVAEHAVRTRYPGRATDVALTPGKGVVVPLIETHPSDRIRFEAVVKGAVPRSGRVGVDVSLLVNGKRREVVPLLLDIAPAPAGIAPSTDNRQQPVRPAANWTPGPTKGAPATIKARDNVKLVVALGDGARIEALGEALEDGRIGQVIRIRNADSNRIVHGRVEANGIITVEP